ncbi:hypothetical protein RGU12_02155 [Fredinandcohnia sp. QZ13]|uniref:hypothetical protein n=1 Tax=Fredinandcohnia sp. QZ13 TaxID=3073144 RepID=UPI0028533F6F|nr:hypothetical protein [Fredinandcohnia sp. QZ13]MDR4886346.1 hypothetical protein [Fredinandcohnia sp. QZ13]
MRYYYSPEVKFSLMNESKERVQVHYLNQSFELPQIGVRPPYYYNPRYEHHYPLI